MAPLNFAGGIGVVGRRFIDTQRPPHTSQTHDHPIEQKIETKIVTLQTVDDLRGSSIDALGPPQIHYRRIQPPLNTISLQTRPTSRSKQCHLVHSKANEKAHLFAKNHLFDPWGGLRRYLAQPHAG